MASEPLSQRNEKGPLPLVLAVSGHRDLRKEDFPELRKQLLVIFSELAESYPSTPLQLLSGLAEGADSLAASVALECNIPFVACLPMEKLLFQTDFETPECLREFEALLAKAARVVTMPLADGVTVESVKAQGPMRDLQYQRLAEYLVAQSQILVAFWDGVDTKLVGGTSSVVRMQLGAQLDGGDIHPDHPLDFPETGPVFHIVTPRVKNPKPAGEAYHVRKLWHLDPACKSAEESHGRIFSRIDEFNEDAIKKGGMLKSALEQSKEWLFPEKVRAGLGESVNAMIGYYSLADALAIYYQRLTRNALFLLIFVSGLSAVVFFECFAHCPEVIQIAALSLYVFIILVTYGSYQFVKPGRFKTKHLDYRALAEGLRLQIFWRFAGAKEQVADYYLRKQKTELDWIRNAIRVWTAVSGAGAAASPDFGLVQKHWVEDQFKFFDKAATRDHHSHQKEKRITFWILLITIGIALTHLFLWVFFKNGFETVLSHELWKDVHSGRKDSMDFRDVVVIVMALLPAVAGAIAAYSIKMAVSEQEKQYHRMRNLFQRGSKCLGQALKDGNDALALKTILDLGKEALEENGDWVVLHRERSVEVHLAG